MKYSVDTTIDLPRDRVIELLDDADNLKKWQRGLETFEHLEGDPGQVGARSHMVFKMGKRKLEIVETIIERAFPDTFTTTYEAKGVYNLVKNHFEEVAPDKTKWTAEHEFKFSGFMKVIGFLAGKAFPRQSEKYMADFKAFAEDGVDVNA